MLNYDECLALRRFCQEITYKPRPLDEQPCARQGVYIFCEDWEMIEITKFFFLGEETYFSEVTPRRLKNNPLFDKDIIKQKAQALFNHNNGNVEAIIEYLRGERNASRVA